MTHSHPYNIQWLNQSKGIQVNSWCLVSLSSGTNYQDELWCDVIPMDACHILLGRPWLYDRKLMHNGLLNTYSFTKEQKKISLAPLSPSKLHQDKLLTFSKPLIKASHHEFKAFEKWILNIQDEPEFPLPSHPIAKGLVNQFCHLFPEEIPTGLQPKRDIQHHIDLVTSSVLPNKLS